MHIFCLSLFLFSVMFLSDLSISIFYKLQSYIYKSLLQDVKTCRTQVSCLRILKLQNKFKIKHKIKLSTETLKFKHKYIIT